MFNLGPMEIIFILVVALIVLGPQRLPQLARGLGRFFFEFRRQTDEVRGMVEREFYRMDEDVKRAIPEGAVAQKLPGPSEEAPSEQASADIATPPTSPLEGS